MTSAETKPAANPSPVQMLLTTLGLVGLALVQPVLSTLGENPILFASNNVTGGSLFLFTVAIMVVPALVIWLPAGVTHRFHPPVAQIIHLATVAILVALTGVQWSRSAGIDSTFLRTAIAVLLAAGVVVAYQKRHEAREWTRYLAVMPLLAGALFLFGSETGDLWRQSEVSVSSVADDIERPDVVMLLLDQLPTRSILDEQGTIDPVRFPALASFAESATWYRQHTTMSAATSFAVPALLTGNDPKPVEPLATNYPDNLFTMLAPTHHLTVYEAPTKLCAIAACTTAGPEGGDRADSDRRDLGAVIDQTWTLWLDRIRPDRDPQVGFGDDFTETVTNEGTPAPAEAEPSPTTTAAGSGGGIIALTDPNTSALKPARLLDFADTIAASERSAFYFLHLVLPHSPWHFHPDGELYTPPSFLNPFIPESRDNDLGDWVLTLTEQRHLTQAQYADALVGQLLATLVERQVYDDAMVVIMADHGISLVPETEQAEMSPVTLSSMAYSPLLIKYPGQTVGEIDDRNAMSIDLVPTIADVLEIDPDWAIRGSSLLADDGRGDDKYAFQTEGVFGKELKDRIDFDGPSTAPAAADRWVGPIEPGEPALMGSHRRAGIDDLIGQTFDELVDRTAGEAVIDERALFESTPGAIPPGVIVGEVRNAPPGPVVIAVDGIIVTGGTRYRHGERLDAFSAMLPSGTIDGTNTVQVGIRTPDGIVGLEIVDPT
ncbi:MAG: sulfatase-like hydrolase/transferase [Acidimicrobiales bacterium]|nr:sulfatase-like hydrolase/transferase [Acidimicrobiales bacterium]